ncbi:hypothetical protein ABW21_db0200399 [Orbilia brochopaga]|nr:hypothetical protein ABW21_db0200399 [Drechslerella brochopaga]
MRTVFVANPSENFRKMLDEDMRANLPEGSNELQIWEACITVCHDFILEGMKRNPCHLPAGSCRGFKDIVGYEPDPAVDIRTPRERKAAQLGHYLRLLQSEPTSVSRTERFLEAVIKLIDHDSFSGSAHLCSVAVEVQQLQRSSAEIATENPAALETFMMYYIRTVAQEFPCELPGPIPELTLPPLKACGHTCDSDPVCSLCASIDGFLACPISDRLKLGMSKARGHVHYVWKCIEKYSQRYPITYDPSEMIHPDGEALCTVEVHKKAAVEWRATAERLQKAVAGRRRWLSPIGIDISDAGELVRAPPELPVEPEQPVVEPEQPPRPRRILKRKTPEAETN